METWRNFPFGMGNYLNTLSKTFMIQSVSQDFTEIYTRFLKDCSCLLTVFILVELKLLAIKFVFVGRIEVAGWRSSNPCDVQSPSPDLVLSCGDTQVQWDNRM